MGEGKEQDIGGAVLGGAVLGGAVLGGAVGAQVIEHGVDTLDGVLDPGLDLFHLFHLFQAGDDVRGGAARGRPGEDGSVAGASAPKT
jgi:hypothetical protein